MELLFMRFKGAFHHKKGYVVMYFVRHSLWVNRWGGY